MFRFQGRCPLIARYRYICKCIRLHTFSALPISIYILSFASHINLLRASPSARRHPVIRSPNKEQLHIFPNKLFSPSPRLRQVSLRLLFVAPPASRFCSAPLSSSLRTLAAP